MSNPCARQHRRGAHPGDPSDDRNGAPQSERDGDPILRAVEAVLKDGPLKGTKLEIEAVAGRPPSTIDVSDAEGAVARYCLAEWTQEGISAEYTFLYPV